MSRALHRLLSTLLAAYVLAAGIVSLSLVMLSADLDRRGYLIAFAPYGIVGCALLTTSIGTWKFWAAVACAMFTLFGAGLVGGFACQEMWVAPPIAEGPGCLSHSQTASLEIVVWILQMYLAAALTALIVISSMISGELYRSILAALAYLRAIEIPTAPRYPYHPPVSPVIRYGVRLLLTLLLCFGLLFLSTRSG